MLTLNFSMKDFEETFERCAKACRESNEELGLDPDAIEVVGLPNGILDHRKTLERDTICGLITDNEYRHYVNVLTSVNNIGSVTALVICCTIFTPGVILSLDYSAETFTDSWNSRIAPALTKELAHEAQDIVQNTDLLTMLMAAQSQIEELDQGRKSLGVPKQRHLGRRKSISKFVSKIGLVRKMKAALGEQSDTS